MAVGRDVGYGEHMVKVAVNGQECKEGRMERERRGRCSCETRRTSFLKLTCVATQKWPLITHPRHPLAGCRRAVEGLSSFST